MDNICKNCGDLVTKKFCGNCGNKNEITRIDKKYALNEFLNLINFDKGFLYTAKGLLLNPGFVINEYINENRKKITKPITFIILTSLIYSIISQYFNADKIYSEFNKKIYNGTSLSSLSIWFQQNMGYANILMIIPITIWAKIFFKNFKYNFYEIFVVISLVMGNGMLIFSLAPPIDKLFPTQFVLTNSLFSVIAFVYGSWAIGQFYGKGAKNFFKAFLTYIFGFLTFQFTIAIVALAYDILLKK